MNKSSITKHDIKRALELIAKNGRNINTFHLADDVIGCKRGEMQKYFKKREDDAKRLSKILIQKRKRPVVSLTTIYRDMESSHRQHG
jgi:hypothetical protein